MHLIAWSLLSLAAGHITVFLIDRFAWPGTLQPGAVGVVVAVVVVGLLGRRDRST
ncbi:MAG: hypothetical protein WC829_11635 [Hyphomicrobium sp.]|jgi:hypothetical protein